MLLSSQTCKDSSLQAANVAISPRPSLISYVHRSIYLRFLSLLLSVPETISSAICFPSPPLGGFLLKIQISSESPEGSSLLRPPLHFSLTGSGVTTGALFLMTTVLPVGFFLRFFVNCQRGAHKMNTTVKTL